MGGLVDGMAENNLPSDFIHPVLDVGYSTALVNELGNIAFFNQLLITIKYIVRVTFLF